MKDDDDEIEIKEPPLKELTKSRKRKFGCISFGCTPGCFVIMLLFAGVFTVIFFISTGPKKIKTPPDDFPKSIQIYNPGRIEEIVYLSAKRKNRGLEIAAFAPKLVLYPVSRALDWQSAKKFNEIVPENPFQNKVVDAKNFFNFMKTPIGPQTNVVAIEWRRLTADKDFLLNFYKDSLQHSGFTIDEIVQKDNQFSFIFRGNTARGWLRIQRSGIEEYATEKMTLFAEYEN